MNPRALSRVRLGLATAAALLIPCRASLARADEPRTLRAPYPRAELALDVSADMTLRVQASLLTLRAGIALGDHLLLRATAPQPLAFFIGDDLEHLDVNFAPLAPSTGLFARGRIGGDLSVAGGVEVASPLGDPFVQLGVDPLFWLRGGEHTFVTRFIGGASHRGRARTTSATVVLAPSMLAGSVDGSRDDAARVDLGVAWPSGAQLGASVGVLHAYDFESVEGEGRKSRIAAAVLAGWTSGNVTGYAGVRTFHRSPAVALGMRWDAWR